MRSFKLSPSFVLSVRFSVYKTWHTKINLYAVQVSNQILLGGKMERIKLKGESFVDSSFYKNFQSALTFLVSQICLEGY